MPFGKPAPCNFIISEISIVLIYDVCPISKESPGASCAGRFPTIDVPAGGKHICFVLQHGGQSDHTAQQAADHRDNNRSQHHCQITGQHGILVIPVAVALVHQHDRVHAHSPIVYLSHFVFMRKMNINSIRYLSYLRHPTAKDASRSLNTSAILILRI